jgi:hypothetical protein
LVRDISKKKTTVRAAPYVRSSLEQEFRRLFDGEVNRQSLIKIEIVKEQAPSTLCAKI